jgi:hypothetical protein
VPPLRLGSGEGGAGEGGRGIAARAMQRKGRCYVRFRGRDE